MLRWLCCVGLCWTLVSASRMPCYDDWGRAQRCKPPFMNAAFALPVKLDATNTCGLREPELFCLQTERFQHDQCDYCDARDPARAHPPQYLTDYHQENNLTWWQSETMKGGIQFPNMVNLTISLGISFDVTYVGLRFYNSRPESFAIYKRTTEDGPWIPYQYYSASCQSTYDVHPGDFITRDDETKALCSSEYSDISPLTGGHVVFSTLDGRPSATQFEDSPVLQEWVRATDIRITLNRLNTFGDEIFQDAETLQSYYYAISDFAIGGTCHCNGHASECVRSTGQGLEERQVCRCEHHTDGTNCEQCLPFYNDQPWARATPTDAHECQPCNCNDFSNRCYFDADLYAQTGHGGHCLDCRDNTAGVNCERCRDDYYRRDENDRCRQCDCNPTGSAVTQCDISGRCRCKPGVTGDKCDRCMPNYYEFGPNGCRECECLIEGSRDNNPMCQPDTGICQCKDYVEGQNCDQCKPGFFGLHEDDPLGCTSCFCHGHSSVCESARGYSQRIIQSEFITGTDNWIGKSRSGEEIDLEFNAITEKIGLSAPSVDATYFVAPEQYLGNQLFTYNQYLIFSLRVGEDGARASVQDVVLEGDGLMVSTSIYSQANPLPLTFEQEYRFRLHEHPSYYWSPSLSAFQFQRILSNLTAIKIRATYSTQGVGFLDSVQLQSGQRGWGDVELTSVEQCTCPDGYVGQFCESCAPGYYREEEGGGAYTRCVPCNCNGHSDACDVNTGRCICQHNTDGDNCERCASGYYGYAMGGTPDDCQICPCPGQGDCVQLLDGDVACLECDEGTTGNRCEMCADGFYGDPAGRYGPQRRCSKCTCNDNIDHNAVANCNMTTGECLKCIYNTGGYYCDRCLPGYYGDALSLPKGDCQPCNCYPPGNLPSGREDGIYECDQRTGQCDCQVRVVGERCDKCQDGYWNINSGTGCERCNCDLIGAFNSSCDLYSGQCLCKEGVKGRQCDMCDVNQYGFSYEGCSPCECDPHGSQGLQCNEPYGQCPCKDNVEGRTCDRCVENKYNISAGCIDCPPCYDLVQDHVNVLRTKVNDLRMIIENIGENPQAINDTDFRMKMAAVNTSVVDLWEDAMNTGGAQDGSLAEQLKALQAAVDDIIGTCNKVSEDIYIATKGSDNAMIDIEDAIKMIDEAETRLRDAQSYIDVEGQKALREAKEAQAKFGQQSERMTEVARQARIEAERQEVEAGQIEKIAEEARNTSAKALRLAQEALRKPQETAEEIEQITNEITKARELLEQTKQTSQTAKEEAQASYEESLAIYTEAVSLSLPDIDVEQMNAASKNVKDEAEQIKSSAAEVLNQHYDLLDDVEKQKKDAQALLENGVRQQQIADELLADADAARDIATKALEKAEQTLNDANETLRTLKEFDDKVQQSKDEAEIALEKIPEIESHITEAEERTWNARNDLANALDDAEAAREIAEQAQVLAERASEEASSIREQAEQTKERAKKLLDDAMQMENDIQDVTRRLEEYEQQGEEDEQLAKEALQKADEAKEAATESSAKVSQALRSVENILRQLNNVDSINTEQLDALEQHLGQAEDQLLSSNIENRYAELMASRQQQSIWVRDYTDELIQLRKDVENIRVINETIPRQCFKETELEPEDPTIR